MSLICFSAIASTSKKVEKESSFCLEKNRLPSLPVTHWLRLILPPLKDEDLSVLNSSAVDLLIASSIDEKTFIMFRYELFKFSLDMLKQTHTTILQ